MRSPTPDGAAGALLQGINLDSVLASMDRHASPQPSHANASADANARDDDMAYLSDGVVDFDSELRQFQRRARASLRSAGSRRPDSAGAHARARPGSAAEYEGSALDAAHSLDRDADAGSAGGPPGYAEVC